MQKYLNTASNTFHEAELQRRPPRKTPLLKDVHLKVRLKFARERVDKDNIFWRQVLWSHETKIELFSHE